MERYSFPYQRGLHNRLTRTTLKPVMIICVVVVLALPFVLTGVLTVQANRNSAALATLLDEEQQRCATGLMQTESSILAAYLRNGTDTVHTWAVLYTLRNTYAPGARFELVSLNGTRRATDLPLQCDYSVRRNASLIQELRTGKMFARGVNITRDTNDDTPLVILTAPVYDGEDITGCLSLLWTRSYLLSLAEPFAREVVLTAGSGRVIFQSGVLPASESTRFDPENGFVSVKRVDGSLYIIRSISALDGELVIYTLMPFNFILPVMFFSLLFAALLAGVMMIVINRVCYQMATGPMMKPFDQLFSALEQYGKGNTLARIAADPEDESYPYLLEFNQVLDEVDGLLARNRELERANMQSELKALQSQFNPHFIFNMLETIKYSVYDDPKCSVHMLLTLAAMLRYTLETDTGEVPLREDLKYMRGYLEMQQLRLGELFSYEIAIPERLLDRRVPRLILQPLVENSLKYGYTGERPFLVTLRAEEKQGVLCLTVENNGPGMEADRAEQLRRMLEKNEAPRDHIGIYNTHRRLRLAYGEGAGLCFESSPQGMVTYLTLGKG